ncbi:unnamed protein product [Clonostachys rhizophaga]|uniref:RNase H type-1 domain-containing protein n=1 Tax=Clonostachys rhizophaga TaxID=160324 RepID=A0A9N9VE66_9HYPO|nr:unnamed protein product [Clonostachys rhizophaga]CAH0020140.1 unnamed protein product [Clonostachys rhizophaga]
MGRDPHCKAENQEWSSDRRFDPSQRYADDVDLALVEDSNFDDAWTYVACDEDEPCRDCGRLAPHLDCLVIAVDGACRQNGKSTAVASIGVFVHGNSSHNSSRLLHKPKVTNQLAELWAGVEALQLAIRIRDEGMIEYPLRQAVIKADSEYFVRGMTEWIFKVGKKWLQKLKGKTVRKFIGVPSSADACYKAEWNGG